MIRPTLLLAALVATALAGCSADAAATRIVIDFPEPHPDVDDAVALAAIQDAAGASAPLSAHAQLLAWSLRSGTDVDISAFSFGHCLDAIDGLPTKPGCSPGAEAYWSLAVNGEVVASGMDEIVLAAGDVVTWTYTPIEAASSTGASGGPALTVDPVTPTQQEMLMLTGSLDRAAKLSVTGADPVDAKAGPWMVHVPLAYGRTPLTVTADDGVASTQAQVVAVRLASATFQAKFTMAVPAHPEINDLVWYDPDELASAPAYAAVGAQHIGEATVHDLMVAWELQSGKAIDYTDQMSFESFGVEGIDGVRQPLTSDAPPWWCYKLNGATSDFGISLQPLAPGDVVTWEFAGCA